MTKSNVAQLLFDTSIRELDIEKERKENIETKAQRFVIFSGILFSIISTYFLVFFDRALNKIYLVFLILSIIILTISILYFIYTLKTYNYTYFDMEELIIFAQDCNYDDLIKRLTGTFSEYITERRVINNHKVSFIVIGYRFFFSSLILMIIGIVLFICNL